VRTKQRSKARPNRLRKADGLGIEMGPRNIYNIALSKIKDVHNRTFTPKCKHCTHTDHRKEKKKKFVICIMYGDGKSRPARRI